MKDQHDPMNEGATMRKAIATALAISVMAVIPASAGAVTIHQHIVAPDTHKVITRVITVAPPDRDDDGVANADDQCPGTPGEASYNGCPPPAPAPVTTTTTSSTVASTAPAPAPAPTGGSGCVGMEAESGSTGYATNTGNGYIGCYQISQDHFSPTGSCAGDGTDPAGQDACAATICATEGPGAWTNSAGENPCGRLGG